MTPLAAAVAVNRCGFPGEMAQEHIPSGWAQVESWIPQPHAEQFYVGPIVEDNADWIAIDVFGSPMTFSRDRVIVTYAL